MKLKQLLSTDAGARKIFGKKEIGIILKQMGGVVLTQSEKNRLSRDIRPKLEFIKKISAFEKEFRLKKNQGNRELISKALEAILNDKQKDSIRAVLLFGSFASDTATPSSDIDICALFKKEITLKEATQFRIRISGQLPERVDVQVFNILPQKIKREIAKNHKILYAEKAYDNVEFTIKYLKDEDYFIRMNKIFGIEA